MYNVQRAVCVHSDYSVHVHVHIHTLYMYNVQCAVCVHSDYSAHVHVCTSTCTMYNMLYVYAMTTMSTYTHVQEHVNLLVCGNVLIVCLSSLYFLNMFSCW